MVSYAVLLAIEGRLEAMIAALARMGQAEEQLMADLQSAILRNWGEK